MYKKEKLVQNFVLSYTFKNYKEKNHKSKFH